MTRLAAYAMIAATAACKNQPHAAEHHASAGPRPDELPVLVVAELPFKYPAALYARKVQGNVMLKLFIDRDGRVIADSTRIDEPSGYPELDSAALRGASELRFIRAKLHGEPIPESVLFPAYFRPP